MAEYIEREAAIAAAFSAKAVGNSAYRDVYDTVSRLRLIPTADVQLVVHGHWIVQRGNYNEEFECSECQHISKDGGNYCSHCGAKMEVDDAE